MPRILLRGIGASIGRITGQVKIIMDVRDVPKMEEGDVLVAPYTTPLLTLAMTKASAIITDTGGLTCHAAVVARELGVPCVVATGKATKVLRDDLEVTVDGGKGIVTG